MNKRFLILSIIVFLTGHLFAQSTVKGIIKNEAGETVPGVTIMIKSSKTGTTTDIDGKYSIKVSPNDVLVFSGVGLKKQEIPVGTQSQIDVTMKDDATQLEEAVVVGYGTQKRANLTGAVASMSASEVADLATSNLSTAIKGRMAGVSVSQGSGRPGGANSFTIRSPQTLSTSTSPLFVIDNIIMTQADFDNLDASMIESFSILKDSEAAVYGARGANGVVIVKTKTGKKGGKPQITYQGSVGVSSKRKNIEMLSAYDQAKLLNDGYDLSNIPPTGTTNLSYYTDDELAAFKNLDYNWLDPIWKSSSATRHTLNVSGGSDKLKFFTGGSYYYETGNFDRVYSNKYSFRGGIEADILPSLTATVNVSFDQNSNSNLVQKGANTSTLGISENVDRMSGFIATSLLMPRWIPYSIDGKLVSNAIGIHPMGIINSGSYNNTVSKTNTVNASIDYKIPGVKGLDLKVQYALINRSSLSRQYYAPYTVYTFSNMTGTNQHIYTNLNPTAKTVSNGDQFYYNTTTSQSYQLDAYLSYARQFNKHNINATFVAEQAESSGDGVYGTRGTSVSPGVDQMWAYTLSTSSIYGSPSESGNLAYLGRLNYDYAGKYIFESSFRYEASQKFAKGKRWGLFPSLSAGWRISEEPFFKENIKFIDNLKFRGSWGLLGSDDVGDFTYLQRYSSTTGAWFNNTTTNGLDLGALPNPNITWEKTRTTNIGFDASILNNHLTISLDQYFKHGYDLLDGFSSSLPTSTGITSSGSAKINSGIIDMWGTEIGLGYNGSINKDFKYKISGNFGWNRNKVKKESFSTSQAGTYLDPTGKSTSTTAGFICTGMIRTQDDLNKLLAQYPNWTINGVVPDVGFLNYKDLNGDGKITSDDQTIIDPGNNQYGFSFTLGASWKGLSLDANFGGAFGGKQYYDKSATTPPTANRNALAIWKDHWTPTNTNAKFPRADAQFLTSKSTYWETTSNTSFYLNNMTISYVVPSEVLKKISIQQLKVYLTGTNLLSIINHLDYKDPLNSNYYDYPALRTISLGVNCSF